MEGASQQVQKQDQCSDVNGTFQEIYAHPDKEKDNAYYSALVAAWIDTRMERDKSILALSTASIGLLFTLLTTVGAASVRVIVLYSGCFLLFLISIICSVTIFGWNAAYIQCLLRNEAPQKRRLDILDGTLFGCFIAGLVLTVVLGIVVGVSKLRTENSQMGDQIKTNQQPIDGQKSLSGLEKLSPSNQGQSQSSANTGTATPAPQASSSSSGQAAPASSSQSTQGQK
jgi:hypothetical protein